MSGKPMLWPRPVGRAWRDTGITAGICVGELHGAVAAGLGIGALPEFMCRQGLAMKRLVRLLPDWEVADQVELTAVSPADRAADPAVRSFVDYLGAHVVPALAGAPEAPVVAPTARKAAG